MNICIECNKTFEPDKYHPHQEYCCTKCRARAGERRYRKRHPERRKEISRRYESKNQEKRREYRKNNTEKTKERNKRFLAKYPEKTSEYSKRYYYKNKQKCLEATKNWRVTHQGYGKKWRKNNPDKTALIESKKRKMKHIELMNNIWLSIPEIKKVNYHHLLNNIHLENPNVPENKWFVIPMPEITHTFVNGNSSDYNHWRHNNIWIKKLYGIIVKELLSG